MKGNRNGKRTIWMYAVILFTSAFIVLLLTAYSQIKFNKNIDDYKNQISSEKMEKTNYQLNLKSTLEENKKFKEELEALKEQISNMEIEEENNLDDIDVLYDRLANATGSYEVLLQAENRYYRGDIVGCAKLLRSNIDYELLGSKGQEKFRFLKEKTYKKAAYTLFLNGFEDYKIKKYKEASSKFELSNKLASNEYYSDDSLYFLGYCELKQGNEELAEKTFRSLLSKYPKSMFKKEITSLLSTMN